MVGVLVLVGATLSGTALLIVDLVGGRQAGVTVGTVFAVVIALAWLVFPVLRRVRST
jgi:hypothetical protein